MSGDFGGSGLENRRSGAHIRWMATIVQCNCGAEYRRTEEKFLIPHTGDAVCMIGEAALASPSRSSTLQWRLQHLQAPGEALRGHSVQPSSPLAWRRADRTAATARRLL